MSRHPVDSRSLSAVLAENVRQLRGARGLTQAQLAKSAGVPRATWANLESGEANPTLHVLSSVSRALGVTMEELLRPPRAACVFHPRETLDAKRRGTVSIRHLLPDPVPGSNIDRMELPPGARMTGVPHTPGTREYLTVERGSIVLAAAGERFTLREGDVVAFRGDQRHSYANPSASETAIGYSVVILVADDAQSTGVLARAGRGRERAPRARTEAPGAGEPIVGKGAQARPR